MVISEHAMLTRVLHIPHLRAVMGISMGGMQSFQWILSYPEFMDKAIPIHGSPQLAPYDLLLWQTMKDAVEHDARWKNGDYIIPLHIRTANEISDLALTTPERYNRERTRQKFFESLKADSQRDQLQETAVRRNSRKATASENASRKRGVSQNNSSPNSSVKNANPPEEEFDPDDRIRQLEAMMNHDVSAPFGGSMERAAAAVKVPLLVIVDSHDHMVTPGPALTFARLAHAPALELQSDCGHIASGCEETQKVKDTVAQFLGK
jgi:homoserine O-acetyltransferase